MASRLASLPMTLFTPDATPWSWSSSALIAAAATGAVNVAMPTANTAKRAEDPRPTVVAASTVLSSHSPTA